MVEHGDPGDGKCVSKMHAFDLFSSLRFAQVLFLLCVILLFLGAVSGYFLGNLLFDKTSRDHALVLAAFLGAFFAFTLGAVGRIAMELERRERNGYLALVYLERYFNAVLPNLGRLQDHLKGIIKSIEDGGWWAFSLEDVPEPVEELSLIHI